MSHVQIERGGGEGNGGEREKEIKSQTTRNSVLCNATGC